MRRWVLLTAFCLICSCGKSKPASPKDGGANDVGTGSDVSVTDFGSPDAGALSPCLEQPTALPRPPAGRLPCDLIPPGLR
jgi:hypothetical protein